jgi:hypothetical protein
LKARENRVVKVSSRSMRVRRSPRVKAGSPHSRRKNLPGRSGSDGCGRDCLMQRHCNLVLYFESVLRTEIPVVKTGSKNNEVEKNSVFVF